jgi:carboxymethylenebutenolidase
MMLDVNRRDFLATKLAAGFALAVQPVTAETIHTPADGLEAGEVTIPTFNHEIPGYRAMPAQGKKHPVVLVVQEIFGVHEHIKDVCRRLAHLGYYAIAPELYAREGDVSHLESIDEIRKIVAQVPEAQVMSDLDSAALFAQNSGHGDTSKLGITGFCWGGRIVWLYAAHSKKLKAGVAWYGRLAGPTNNMTPRNPIDVAKSLNAPVLGLYAGQDQGIPLDLVESMKDALKKAGSPSEIVIYPDAQHGFNADYRPSYNEQAAKDGWQKMLAWFKKYHVA